ncbi:MAG TPA: peroxidase family protein, partial [Acetobacteraceae bacterium]|nr:peroxidase family protein [Acetobacteraceae bacterium]
MPARHHGRVRGAETPHLSLQFEGRFGRMFRTLPHASFSPDALIELGAAMTSPPEDAPTPETEVDSEENQGISAGYTYLGQFIDHDLTFDPASSLMQQDDPEALIDFRTPRFDLDNLYGRGADDQPYMYEPDGLHMQLGRKLTGNKQDENTRDLPRHASLNGGPARALIGDPRNDENVIVSQLQATMLRFHNRMVDDSPGATLAEVQRIVRWHYQYVVLHDFLPTIAGRDMVGSILPHLESGRPMLEEPPRLLFYKWRNFPFIPIEFTVAAYRFGHSMVRPLYRLNTTLGKNPPPADDPANGRIAIFDPAGDDKSLTGFREFPSVWAIDWSVFFDMGNKPPQLGVDRLQRAYKIDTSLVTPLGALPRSVAGDPP